MCVLWVLSAEGAGARDEKAPPCVGIACCKCKHGTDARARMRTRTYAQVAASGLSAVDYAEDLDRARHLLAGDTADASWMSLEASSSLSADGGPELLGTVDRPLRASGDAEAEGSDVESEVARGKGWGDRGGEAGEEREKVGNVVAVLERHAASGVARARCLFPSRNNLCVRTCLVRR